MNLLRESQRKKKARRAAPRRAAEKERAEARSRSLGGGGGVLLVGRALPLLPVVVLVRPGRAERSLGAEGLLLGRDRASLLLERHLRQRDDLLGRVLRDVLRLSPRGVSLLCLALPGKDHELALVELQAGDILLKTLRAPVLAAVINRNPDSLRELLRDARLLELIESKPLPETNLGVVALRRAADGGAEAAGRRARGDRRGLLLPVGAAAFLAAGLVKPSPDVALPPLLVVDVRHHLVVLHETGMLRKSTAGLLSQ